MPCVETNVAKDSFCRENIDFAREPMLPTSVVAVEACAAEGPELCVSVGGSMLGKQ